MFTQFAIQIDERDFYGPTKKQVPKPISFRQDVTVVDPFMDENGHQYFDVCSCTAYLEAYYESDEDIRRR